MNEHAYDEDGVPPKSRIDPSDKVVVDSYRKDIANGFEKEGPMYNPMNPERTQSSALVDLKDPIQVHLLTETALTDSKEYEILSQEEIDGLKKQTRMLTQRVESTRSNLLIQSKYRDAAISMAKLYPSTRANDSSSLGDQASPDESNREAEEEREACERKCEELATELFHLEKRLMEPKRRLLEHTAGILQLTHKASKKKPTAPDGQPLNGIPGSPESLYTYTQSRNSLEAPDETYTDDTALPGLDQSGSRKNAIEIPLKSPIRGQNNQLKEEMDRMREENKLLMDSVAEMEQRLENLNGSLRETIVRFNPEENSEFEGPPSAAPSRDLKAGEILRSQIDYLESGLGAIQAEQESCMDSLQAGGQVGDVDKTLVELWELIQSGYSGIKQQKDDRRRARAEKGLEDDESDDDGIDLSESYSVLNFSSRVRWLYRQATMLKDQRSVLRRQIKQQRELNNKSDAEKDAELAQKQEELEQNRLVVERAEKDAVDAQKMLSEALEDLEKAREDAGPSKELQAELQERTARTQVLEAKLEDMRGELDVAESDSKNTQDRLAQVDSSITALSSQLDEATRSKDVTEQKAGELEKRLEEKQAALKAREDEFEELNVSYAELKTEVTIARAELDGAYGTRAERAADAAAKQNSGEVDKLKSELAATAKELEDVTKETIASEREKVDLEGQLDDALAAKSELEAEMGALRGRLDDEVHKSKEHISKLQEELDGERLRAGRGSGDSSRPGAGASMLSEKFRTTMREERKKYQEDIKEERARNRKLEEELARLKRAQGPGKSPLSPR